VSADWDKTWNIVFARELLVTLVTGELEDRPLHASAKVLNLRSVFITCGIRYINTTYLRRYKLIKRGEVFERKASKTAGHEFEDFRLVLGVKKPIFSYFIEIYEGIHERRDLLVSFDPVSEPLSILGQSGN
jgi:hypothetical protein